MAASVFDSRLYEQLFPTGDVGRLFTDSAEIRAMMLVEGALAKVQGAQGIIPEESAAAIHRAAMEAQIDPGTLAAAVGRNGVPVPGLVAAFRAEMNAPEHAQYLHWGATSQDIADTGLMLRLRQALAALETGLDMLLSELGEMAEAHAETPMAARTWGQHATPTSFGAVVAAWGAPLLVARDDLAPLRRDALWVSLSGAAGTATALGPEAAATRSGLAEALGLGDPGRSWHSDRTPILKIADWLGRLTIALGKLGEDVTELAMSGIGEVYLGGAGASSTMPQKQNPVSPSALVAVARVAAGQAQTLLQAGIHRHQRDGAAWLTEWMTIPQLVLESVSALIIATDLASHLTPRTATMLEAVEDRLGLVHAEALSFALAQHMPRPEAQAAVKTLCKDAIATGTPLTELAKSSFPDLGTSPFHANAQMGHAPTEARAFAARVGR